MSIKRYPIFIVLIFLLFSFLLQASQDDLVIGEVDETLQPSAEQTRNPPANKQVYNKNLRFSSEPAQYKAWRPLEICPSYIDKDGSYGKKGKVLIKEMLGLGKAKRNWRGYNIQDLLMKAPMNKGKGRGRCPSWKSMSRSQKLNYYVALFGLLARSESTCREGLDSKCTGSRCRGELQIEKEWQRRVGKKRGRGCVFDSDPNRAWKQAKIVRPKKRKKSKIWEDNMTCAVQTMANSVCGFHTPKGNGRCAQWTSPWRRGYWAPLNKPYKIFNKLSSMPGCKN